MEKDKNGSFSDMDEFIVDIQRAQEGDVIAAKYLIKNAGALILQGKSLPPDLADWLGHALTLAGSSTTPHKDIVDAFNLRLPAGRKPKHTEETERLIAQSIHESKLGKHKAYSAKGEMGAYNQAALEFCISENTAASYYKKHRASI